MISHIRRNSTAYKTGGLSAAVLAVAIPFVSQWEGFYGHKYKDSVGVSTICYGATAADGVDLNRTYTKSECQEMLGRDLPKYDAQAAKCVDVAALPPHRHAAIISLVYNIGGDAFCKSRVAYYLNRSETQHACDAFLAYNHGGGRVIAGLTNRRISERKLCLMEN